MASDVKINFVIGGTDAVARAFLSVRQAADRAIKQGVQSERAAAKERVNTARAAEREVLAAKRATEREAERARRAEVAREREMAREVVAVVRQANREKLQEERKVERERQRIANQERARNENLARERQRTLGGIANGALGGAARGVGQVRGIAGAAMSGLHGVANTLMGGLGVEVGLGRGVRVASERATLATDLINASVSGPEAESLSMVDRQKKAAELTKKAQEVGAATAMDPTKILEGLGAFVGKTGDLKTGVESIGDLARIARATGSSVADVASAAGDVSANLGDMANKGEVVATIMRTFAGQGKLGAVEVKDLSKQMAGLAAQTSMFGTDATTAMASLGAVTQESRQRGGSKSAAQAVTSAQSFVNTFNKGRTADAFKSMGVEYKNEKGLLDPEEIIVNALRKTGGDSVKMGKLFSDVRARSATLGFESLYRKAGGGEAGIEAVRNEFKTLRGAQLGKGDEAAAFAASMETPAAKAEKFQQRLDQLSMDMADKLMPAMLKFVPVAEKGADVLLKFVDAIVPHADALAASLSQLVPVVASLTPTIASVVGFAAKHPALAATGIIGGNAAMGAAGAAATSVLGRMAIGGAITGTAGGAGLKAALTGAAGLTGTTALGAGAAGIVGYGVGTAATNKFDENLGDRRKILNEANALEFKIRGGNASAAEVKRGQELVGQLNNDFGGVTGLIDKVTGGNQGEDAAKLAAALNDALGKAQVKLDASSQVTIAPGTEIAVRVTNPGDIGGSGGLQGPKAQTE